MITLTKTINKLPKNPLLKTDKVVNRFEMNIKNITGDHQQTTFWGNCQVVGCQTWSSVAASCRSPEGRPERGEVKGMVLVVRVGCVRRQAGAGAGGWWRPKLGQSREMRKSKILLVSSFMAAGLVVEVPSCVAT